MNQEMMKFYRENKVNPFASCLPMLAQFPVFISLYYMLRIDLRYDICPEINPVSSNNPQPCGSTDGVAVPLHPGPDRQGDRLGAGDPDRALRRLAAVLDAADVDDDGQDAAHDLPGAAVHLRPRSSSSSRPACSCTGSRRTSGRSCSRRSSASASARCGRPAPTPEAGCSASAGRRRQSAKALAQRALGRRGRRRCARRNPPVSARSRRAGRPGRRRHRHVRRRNVPGDGDERIGRPREGPVGARQRRAGAAGLGRRRGGGPG